MQSYAENKAGNHADNQQPRANDHRFGHVLTPFAGAAPLPTRTKAETPYRISRLSPMLHKITSSANPLVKTLKSLHAKKGRAETGLFLAEGARLAAEAGELGVWPEIMMFAETALERPQSRVLVERAEKAGARCIATKESVLGQIARRENPQTIVSAYRKWDTSLERLAANGKLWLALERVRDPGNLGTVLRTADAAGAGGVILIGETCDPFSVEAVRASMGAIFATPFAQTALGTFTDWANSQNMHIVGTSLRGTMRHDAAPPEGATALLMGNEQSGLTEAAEAVCDVLVRIPMAGKADSLNLAAASAVMIYDFWRRRGYDGA